MSGRVGFAVLRDVLKPPEYILNRVVGLTDDEMLWEPVPSCLTLRDIDGSWRDDAPPERSHFEGSTSPVTTIGWRLVHIARDVLTSERNPVWLGLAEVPPRPQRLEIPRSASGVVEWLQESHAWWSAVVASCDDEYLLRPIGSVAGQWDGPRAGFVAYINMELVHHGAEVGVLRDLWANRGSEMSAHDLRN